MDHATKIGLIIGAVLVIVGLLILTVMLWINHWDFSKLSTGKYITNPHPIGEDFTDISITTDTADVLFVPSDDGSCQVVCFEEETVPHRVSVSDGCLTVRVEDHRKWYEHFVIHFKTPKITVTLPRQAYESLTVKGSTGDTVLPGDFSFEHIDIRSSTGAVSCRASASESLTVRLTTGNIDLQELSAGSLDLSVSTGHVTGSRLTCTGPLHIGVSTGKATLSHSTCGSLTSTGSTGNVFLEHVTVEDALCIERSTGDIEFVLCDAAALSIQTDTGDVTGSLRSDKVFITQTDTGRVEVPQTATGGRCQITTGTGDIKIRIEG